MPIDTSEMISIICDIMKHENIEVAIKESFKGAVTTGLCTLVGGVTLGPVGLAVGGIIGGVTSMAAAKKFKPVYIVIRDDFTSAQKQSLSNRVKSVLSKIGIEDVLDVSMYLTQDFRKVIFKVVLDFLRNQMHGKIRYT